MPWALAIGGGVGLLKDQLVDQPQYNAQKKLQAAIAAYSPWTHMQPSIPQAPNAFNDALQFGTTAALMSALSNGKLGGTTINNNSGALPGLGDAPTVGSSYSSAGVGSEDAAAPVAMQQSGLMVGDPSSADANGDLHAQMQYMPGNADSPWSVANSTGNPATPSTSFWSRLFGVTANNNQGQ